MNYESAYRIFPPAFTVDADGNKLHSWRTLILPYLDQQELYDTIDLSKPWDAPENAAARAVEIEAFEPYDIKLPATQTLYHVVNHDQGIFNAEIQTPESSIADRETIMVVQAAKTQAVHWMQPDEYSLHDLVDISATNASGVNGVTHIALSDVSVHTIQLQDLPAEQITGLVTINGGEPPIPALNP
jgi:hypothetical protein